MRSPAAVSRPGSCIPAGYDAPPGAGGRVQLRYFARPDSVAQQLRATIESAVAGQSGLLGAARLVQPGARRAVAAALARAKAAAATVPAVGVRLTAPDGKPYPESRGRYSNGASTQLLLFIFLTSLTGSARLIESRRLGVARRMLSTPTSVATILAGETLGRLAVALLQALLIVVGSALFFGVRWGDPLGDGRGRARLLPRRGRSRDVDRQRVLERGAGRPRGDPARARPGRAGWIDGSARGLPAHGSQRRAPHAPRLGQRRLLDAAEARRRARRVLDDIGVLLAFAAVLIALGTLAPAAGAARLTWPSPPSRARRG